MVFWRRRNDGFKWVAYVPTLLKQRRQRRREQLVQARIEVQSFSQYMVIRAWQSAVAATRRAVVMTAKGGQHGGRLAARMVAAVRHAIAMAAARSGSWARSALAPIVLRTLQQLANRANALLRSQAMRLVVFVGILSAIGGALKATSQGSIDTESQTAMLAGAFVVLLGASPFLYDRFAPALARVALRAIATSRPAGAGAGGPRPGAAWRQSITLSRGLGVAALVAGVAVGATALVRARTPVASGQATVLSGDRVRIGAIDLRLADIVAPELTQTCGEGNRRWPCGQASLAALQALVQRKTVTCFARGADAAGHALAQCFDVAHDGALDGAQDNAKNGSRDGGQDLAAVMVERGFAWSDSRASATYSKAEAAARDAKRGVWRGESLRPVEWRERTWDTALKQAPNGCPIKGEITRAERIYHMPWSPDYERIRIDRTTKRGQKADASRRWFCTEQEAIEAGFRLAGQRPSSQ